MRGRAWLAMAVLGLVGVLMLAVFPARALMAQHGERQQVAARIKDLDERNRTLQAQRDSLFTDAEIERLARQQYNLVRPNEEVYDIVAPGPSPQAKPPASPSSDRDPGLGRRIKTLLTDVF